MCSLKTRKRNHEKYEEEENIFSKMYSKVDIARKKRINKQIKS
jgi:hypothetical protein